MSKSEEKSKKNKLTKMRPNVLKKKRVYPVRLRFLVLLFASLYARIAMVPKANG